MDYDNNNNFHLLAQEPQIHTFFKSKHVYSHRTLDTKLVRKI